MNNPAMPEKHFSKTNNGTDRILLFTGKLLKILNKTLRLLQLLKTRNATRSFAK